jgi:hypothetical protein
MPFNFKFLVALPLAITALAAITATSDAADEFHCSISPCTYTVSPDGTGTTAHQVYVLENESKTESLSFTCEKITGTASTTTAAEIVLKEIIYDNCKVNGSPGVVWDMNGCEYRLTSASGTTDAAALHLSCPIGKAIEYTIPGGCIFNIAPQTLAGVGYRTIGVPPSREITVTTSLQGIVVTGNAACNGLINTNQKLIGKYVTGNYLLTGETSGGAMADAWYE